MKRAFTLIELAIALVIIGLLVGGALVAQDLVYAGRIRNQLKQISTYTLGAQAFRTKYGCIPGDCIDAARYMSSSLTSGWAGIYNPTGNGNGNGIIEDSRYLTGANPWPAIYDREHLMLFLHLSEANMAPCCNPASLVNIGTANTRLGNIAYPALAVDDTLGFVGMTMNGRHGWWMGIRATTPSVVCGGANMNNYNTLTDCAGPNYGMAPSIAADLDEKMDDGMPRTGIVYAASIWGGDNRVHLTPFNATQNCITFPSSDPNSYNRTYTSGACALFVRF